MQKILATPQSDETVSLFYYKRKLAVYDYTLFEVGTREEHCYLWDETIGKKGSNEISSFVYDLIKKTVERPEKSLNFIQILVVCKMAIERCLLYVPKLARYLMLI